MKKCPKCNELKPLTEFHKNKNKASGYNSCCKGCSKKRIRVKNHEYNKLKAKIEKEILSNHYIITNLKNKGFDKNTITPDLIQMQRLLITLKRNINELQRNN